MEKRAEVTIFICSHEDIFGDEQYVRECLREIERYELEQDLQIARERGWNEPEVVEPEVIPAECLAEWKAYNGQHVITSPY